MAVKKKTSLLKKQKAAPSKPLSRSGSSVDKALSEYEKHDKKVEHHRAKRDMAEAKIRLSGHEIHRQYPGESMPTSVKPKIKVVKSQ